VDTQTWEYKVIVVETSTSRFIVKVDTSILEEELNALGRQGWELVAMSSALFSKVTCTLKRPLA
jgi:pentose-5-phosphate-3-epimerase